VRGGQAARGLTFLVMNIAIDPSSHPMSGKAIAPATNTWAAAWP